MPRSQFYMLYCHLRILYDTCGDSCQEPPLSLVPLDSCFSCLFISIDMSRLRSFWDNYKVLIVMGSGLGLVHWGWYSIKSNPLLKKSREEYIPEPGIVSYVAPSLPPLPEKSKRSDQRQGVTADAAQQGEESLMLTVKGIVHPKIENRGIVYSP